MRNWEDVIQNPEYTGRVLYIGAYLELGFLIKPVFTKTGQRHEVLMPSFPNAESS